MRPGEKINTSQSCHPIRIRNENHVCHVERELSFQTCSDREGTLQQLVNQLMIMPEIALSSGTTLITH